MFFAYFYGPYENYFSLITTIIYQDDQYVSLTDLLILYIMIPVSKGLIPPVLAQGRGNDLGTRPDMSIKEGCVDFYKEVHIYASFI